MVRSGRGRPPACWVVTRTAIGVGGVVGRATSGRWRGGLVGVEPHDLVNQFGQAMLDGNASLFVGAGLSVAAGLPSWGAILEPARVDAQLPEMSDYPLLAEYYVQNTG